MNAYSIGLSALTTSERGLNLVGQNIANANTPGYHRQVLSLAPRVVGNVTGDGVEVQGVSRLRDGLLENSLNANRSQGARVDSELSIYRTLETVFAPNDGALADQTRKLFSAIGELTQNPEDTAQRRVVITAADNVARQLNATSSELSSIRSDLRTRIDDGLRQVNNFASRIADYNKQITALNRAGENTNELTDLRDQLVNRVAELVDVRIIDQPYGGLNLVAGNVPLVVGGLASSLESLSDTSGLSVVLKGTTNPISLNGGELTGQVLAFNDIQTNYQSRLDEFARTLATAFDSVQATGIGLGGPQTTTLGARSVTDANAPLATVAALPVQAGSLFLSITNQATGDRTLQEIAFDPSTQSLTDLANAITTASGGQVQGSVTTGNQLQLQGQTGVSFDFAGRSPTTPTNLAMNGSAAPRVTGVYTGSTDGVYTFQVVGSGTVGSTANLTLQVRDANGSVVATVNIGQGYTANTTLDVGNGLKVSVGAGTTAAGSFTVPVVAKADSTGALAALGVNTLFKGNDASTLAVRSEVLNDPGLLAASRDGNRGDGSNLSRLAALDTQKILGNQTKTLTDHLGELATDTGTAVSSRSDQQTALAGLKQNLVAQQQSVSGIDPNEELTNMLQLQRAFQMAAKYISTVDGALNSLLEIVR